SFPTYEAICRNLFTAYCKPLLFLVNLAISASATVTSPQSDKYRYVLPFFIHNDKRTTKAPSQAATTILFVSSNEPIRDPNVGKYVNIRHAPPLHPHDLYFHENDTSSVDHNFYLSEIFLVVLHTNKVRQSCAAQHFPMSNRPCHHLNSSSASVVPTKSESATSRTTRARKYPRTDRRG
ncbi:hypothetical protein BC936DRAFT_137603, partial [Jimgerdemannia flammicorona]